MRVAGFKRFHCIVVAATAVLWTACATVDKNAPSERGPSSLGGAPTPTTGTARLRVMSYNVENLFDTEHDEGKFDFEFLPKGHPAKIADCQKNQKPQQVNECLEKDWNEERLNLKLAQIKAVVDAVPDQRPDFLALIEVENEAVVSRLAKTLGFKSWLVTDSPDERGIDVALLYNDGQKYSLKESRFHRLKDPRLEKPTRDILEASFQIDGSAQLLTLFVTHWPSQGGPTLTRQAAAETLAKLAAGQIASGRHVAVMGDYNVVDFSDQPSPFIALTQTLASLIDITLRHRAQAKALKLDLSALPVGTYFFGPPGASPFAPDMVWNNLDRFFVSPSLLGGKGLSVDLASFRIHAPKMATTRNTYRKGLYAGTVINGVPKRYDHYTSDPEKAGFSDHFPIYIDFVY